MLHRLATHPYLGLATGTTMALTAGYEAFESLEQIGAHHGVLVYAIMVIIRSTGEIIEGVHSAVEPNEE